MHAIYNKKRRKSRGVIRAIVLLFRTYVQIRRTKKVSRPIAASQVQVFRHPARIFRFTEER